jgi:hypothetical protein
MDDRHFDSLVRSVAGSRSRRTLVGGLLGSLALAVTARWRTPGTDARRGVSGPGDPCRHDNQCYAADTALYCAWNGYGYDGDYNCCALDGSRCGDDSGCCGYGVCSGGWCTGSSIVSSAGTGGVASADASGGSVVVGDINSGGNTGNVISVGNTSGGVSVSGGSVSNVTDVSVAADGGVAIADASGGSGNVAGAGGSYFHNDDRWYGWGDACPWYCDWGYGCANCTTGWCNWNGYCDN